MKSNHGFKSEIWVKGERLTLQVEEEVTFTTQSARAAELKRQYKAVRCWNHNYRGRAATRFFVLAFN